MLGPKRPDEVREQSDASEPTGPNAGGFGEFSGLYRARWAANHPHMTRQWPADERPESSAPAGIVDAERDAAGRPRAVHPVPLEGR
jgi:hypothetical protein